MSRHDEAIVSRKARAELSKWKILLVAVGAAVVRAESANDPERLLRFYLAGGPALAASAWALLACFRPSTAVEQLAEREFVAQRRMLQPRFAQP